MDQLRAALAGPHGVATIVTWIVVGVVLAIGAVHALRPGPGRPSWSRRTAIALPAALAALLLVGSVAPRFHGAAFDVVMFLRMSGFWLVVLVAPLAVGQVLRLRPPRWLQRTHLALAAVFLLLLPVSDLALTRTDTYQPAVLFGPLAVPLLLPVATLAGWWCWTCLQHVRGRGSRVVFALGATVTTLALGAAGLVLEPALADHLLVVGFLPLLGVTALVELQDSWRRRGTPTTPTTPTTRTVTPAQ